MKRALVVGIAVLLFLAALLGAGVVLLAQTQRGTDLLIRQAERFLPVRFDGAHGTLGRGIRFDRVTVELEGREIVIERLAVELRLLRLLFDNRVEIAAVRADSVELVPHAMAAETTAPTPLVLPYLPLDIELGSLEIARLRLPGLPEVALRGAANWTASDLVVRDLVIDSDQLRVAASGSLAGSLQPELELTVEWALPQAGWSGRGELAGPLDEIAVAHEVTGPYRLAISGNVDLTVPAEPAFDLGILVDAFSVGEIALAEVVGTLTGAPDAFVLEAGLLAATPYGEPFPVQASVRGSVGGPAAFELRAEPLEGTVAASGTVDWAEALVVVASGTVRELRLEPLGAGYEGQVGADFTLGFSPGALDVDVRELAGEIDGWPVSGHGRVSGFGTRWRAEGVELALGSNRAVLSGTWQDAVLEVAAHVDAPALEQIGIGATGALTAEVNASGRWPALDGSLKVASPELALASVRSSDLEMVGRLEAGALTGDLGIARLTIGVLQFDTLALTLSGALERAVDWRLGWAGGEAHGQWRQAADALRLEVASVAIDAEGLRVASEQSFVVSRARTGAIDVTPFCLAAEGARACLEDLRLDAGRVSSRGVLGRFPLRILDAFLPAALGRDAWVEGRWDVAGAGVDWSGAVDVAVRGLEVVLPGGEEEPIELPDAEFAGRFVGAGLEVEAQAVGPLFALEGTAQLASLAADGQLSGRVRVTADDLGWLRTLDQRISELGGAVAGEVVLAGTVSRPVVEGTLALRDGRIFIEDPEVRLERIGLEARIDRLGGFTLSGQAVQVRDGKERGRVELAGSGGGLFGGELELEASLRGERLRASHPQWNVELAPDLTLTYANGRPRLTGTIEMPRAEVRLKTLPTSVPQPSVDVVVVGREVAAAPAEAANSLRMNIRVRLGKDVKLSAVAIQAGLRGELNVRRDARRQVSVRGTLDVTGGLVSGQGQTLAIESGTVVYNGPVGNPYVDIRAVRAIEDQTPPVKVGLRIQGNVDRLTSTIFSEPPMAENRALAFLVLGRDIDQQSESDNNQLLTAAINLGLSKSKSLTSELQRISGLDELSAVAEGEDSFAIAAGKRIGESMFLRYTYNTLTAAGALLLSFDLTEKWRLEALSGENAAMDILYRIER